MIGDSLTTVVLQRAMDGAWLRQKSVAANIANHDTPGYKAVNVDFEDALKRAVADFNSKPVSRSEFLNNLNKIKDSAITATQDSAFIERADSSNVNLEHESIELAKVQLLYSYLSREITDYFTRLRYAIREGR